MSTLTPIAPADLAARLHAGAATLIDIREPDEFAREHIAGAVSLPISQLEKGKLHVEPQGAVVFHCRSGMRTQTHCARLAGLVEGEAFMLDGGMEAWKRAGLAMKTDSKAPLEINRQVQITVGALLLASVAGAVLLDPLFVAVPALLGAGLLFAGVSGWCGMANLLALAPWNRRAA